MHADLEMLKMLAYDGSPLVIRTRENPGRDQGTAVERNGVTRMTPSTPEDIRNSLVHYPAGVTVDGIPVQTAPFPDWARTKVFSYTNDGESTMVRIEGPPVSQGTVHNAIAGGVLCTININMNLHRSHHSPTGERNGPWQRALEVETTPVHRIEAGEVPELATDPLGHKPETPRGSDLQARVAERARLQMERSAEYPGVPPEHHGGVFSYFLHEYGMTPFDQGTPIIVHGTPVELECQDEDNPALCTALAQAMYRYSDDLVPVLPRFRGGERISPEAGSITTFEFKVPADPDSDEPEQPEWNFEPVHDLQVEIQVENAGTTTMPADFELMGYDISEMHVRLVPGRTRWEDLENGIRWGYWRENEDMSRQEMNERLENMNEDIHNMVTAALVDPVLAFSNEMQTTADRFQPWTPRPSQAVTVTSRDGRITITHNPAVAEAATPGLPGSE